MSDLIAIVFDSKEQPQFTRVELAKLQQVLDQSAML